MKFALTSSAVLNRLVFAGLLATLGASAMAQGAPTSPAAGAPVAGKSAGPSGEHMGRHDPAKMQAMVAKHMADMKVKLKITPAQEGAWTTYTAAMQPPMNAGARPTPEQRVEFNKLGTPERIDKMRAMRTERMAQMAAAMDKRGDATKALYAALSPEQRTVFDAEHKKHRAHGGRGEHFGGMHNS